MKSTLTLITSLFLFTTANAQSTVWVEQGNAPKTERGNSITHDNSGYIYITGEFQDSVTFNSFQLTEQYGTYCAKYDTSGNFIWAQENMGGSGVTFDGSSHLYLFSNTDQTLKKIDLSGTVAWSTSLFTNSLFGSNGIQDVFVKGTDVYVTGFYSGDAYFGTDDTLHNAGNWDIYIVKINSAGQFQWAATAGGAGLDKGYDIYVNAADEVYATGYFNSTATFGTTPVTSNGSADMYLAKYNSSGGLLWVNTYGGAGLDLAAKIIADDNGFLYTAGRFNTEITIGSTTLYGLQTDAFIAKFAPDGTPVWAKDIIGQGNDEEADLSYEDGDISFIATTVGNVTIDANNMTALGNLDICIGKMDTTGTLAWTKLMGSSSNDEGSGVTLLNKKTYFNGSFQTTASFDSFQLISHGQWDIVTGKIDDDITIGTLETVAGNKFTVYPNPADKILTAELTDYKNAQLEVLNAEGQLMLSVNLQSVKTSIDISNLASGFYFIQLRNAEGISVKKFIKN